jgi:hypothetical protein
MDPEQGLDGNVYNHVLSGVMVIAEALASGFVEMDAVEFERTYDDILSRGEAFAREDDQKFSASLNREDGIRYASLARPFLDSLGKLKEQPKGLPQALRAIALSETAAFWHALSSFKTMCG